MTHQEELITLIKHTLSKIVTQKYSIRLETEGYSSYYDMFGQRDCYLVETYDSKNFTKYPLLLGLMRKDYVTFWQGHKQTGNFIKGGIEHEYYHVRDQQKFTVIGQVTITEEMIKWATISLSMELGRERGSIEFPKIKLWFHQNPNNG